MNVITLVSQRALEFSNSEIKVIMIFEVSDGGRYALRYGVDGAIVYKDGRLIPTITALKEIKEGFLGEDFVVKILDALLSRKEEAAIL